MDARSPDGVARERASELRAISDPRPLTVSQVANYHLLGLPATVSSNRSIKTVQLCAFAYYSTTVANQTFSILLMSLKHGLAQYTMLTSNLQ